MLVSLIASIVLSHRSVDAVTLRLYSASATEFCNELKRQTGREIVASSTVADERMVIRCDNLPVEQVVAQVCDTFGWKTETRSGITTLTTKQSSSEMAKSLDTCILAHFEPYRKAMLDLWNKTEPYSSLDSARNQTAYNQASDALTNVAATQYAEKDRLDNNFNQALLRISPPYRLFTATLASVSDQDLLNLEKSGRIVFSSAPTRDQRPFPKLASPEITTVATEVVARLIASARILPSGQVVTSNGYLATMPSAKDVAAVRLSISSSPVSSGSDGRPPYISGVLVLLNPKGAIINQTQLSLSVASSHPNVESWAPQDASTASFAKAKTTLTPDELVDLVSHDEAPPAIDKALKRFLTTQSIVEPTAAAGRIIEAFTRGTELPLISDVYDCDFSRLSQLPLNPDSSQGELLNALCKGIRSDWQVKDGWLHLRAHEAPLLSANNIPRSQLWQIRDAYTSGGPSIDSYCAFAQRLTDRQASNPLLALLEPLNSNTWLDKTGPGMRNLARFWGSLGKTTQQRILSGSKFQISELPRAATKNLYAACRALFTGNPEEIFIGTRGYEYWDLPPNLPQGIDWDLSQTGLGALPSNIVVECIRQQDEPVAVTTAQLDATRRMISVYPPRILADYAPSETNPHGTSGVDWDHIREGRGTGFVLKVSFSPSLSFTIGYRGIRFAATSSPTPLSGVSKTLKDAIAEASKVE